MPKLSPVMSVSIVIIVVIVVFGGLYLYLNKQDPAILPAIIDNSGRPPVDATPIASTEAPTASWKSYANPTQGFSLQYPSPWYQKDTAKGADSPVFSADFYSKEPDNDSPYGREGVVYLSISINPLIYGAAGAPRPAKTASELIADRNYLATADKRTVTLGQQTATAFTYTYPNPSEGPPSYYKEYILDHNGKVYAIYIDTPIKGSGNLMDIADQVALSLDFTK